LRKAVTKEPDDYKRNLLEDLKRHIEERLGKK
jgi:hypothetical protein